MRCIKPGELVLIQCCRFGAVGLQKLPWNMLLELHRSRRGCTVDMHVSDLHKHADFQSRTLEKHGFIEAYDLDDLAIGCRDHQRRIAWALTGWIPEELG